MQMLTTQEASEAGLRKQMLLQQYQVQVVLVRASLLAS